MVKPKFPLRVTAAGSPAVRESPWNSSRGTPSPAWHKCKSIAHATVNRDAMNIKHQQMEEAIEYCKTSNVRGWAALKTAHFPLIKDAQIINSCLDGFVKNSCEREYCSILTIEEEMLWFGT